MEPYCLMVFLHLVSQIVLITLAHAIRPFVGAAFVFSAIPLPWNWYQRFINDLMARPSRPWDQRYDKAFQIVLQSLRLNGRSF